MQFSGFTSRARQMSIWVLIIAIVMTWIGYLLVGQQLITAFYNSQNSRIAGRFMAGRAFTPVDAYYTGPDSSSKRKMITA
jgi:surface polysaccharide O-acyltransferase-like enzyme